MLFMDEISSILNSPSSQDQWKRLLILPRAILPARLSPNNADSRSVAGKVKARIRRWRAGEIKDLWEEAKEPPKGRGRKRKEPTTVTQEEWNAKRALKFVAEGQFSRASQALLSQGVAPITEENMIP